MSAEVVVAIVSDGALRAYHRNGRQLAQVAQLAVGHEVEPSAMAAMLADLGDALGWSSVGGRPMATPKLAGRVAGALPAGTPQPAKRTPRRQPEGTAAAQRQAVLDVIRATPGIMRAKVAEQLGLDLAAVKRRTDELLRSGDIDATPLPGVPSRGPGGGHGLYAVTPAGADAS